MSATLLQDKAAPGRDLAPESASALAYDVRYVPFPTTAEQRAKVPPLDKALVDWPKICGLAHDAAHQRPARTEPMQRWTFAEVAIATKDHLLAHLDLRRLVRRARSLGGRRRPGARRSTRAASRSPGDPDQAEPGEPAGNLEAQLKPRKGAR